ncbi:MAG TPA: hypothetical protein VK306_14380 [Acidimicrobiales bacterium]|nr:hypothetical protein [Acidimicrobiales bacterium]
MSTIEGVAAIPLPQGSVVSGTAAPTHDWRHDAALSVAVVAVRRTGSPQAGMVAGMPTLCALHALVPC